MSAMLPSTARAAVRPSMNAVGPRACSGPRALPPRASTMVGVKQSDVGPARSSVRCFAEPSTTTSSPASALAAPSLPIGTPDAADKERLQKLYTLLKTDAKKLSAFVDAAGMSVVAISTGDRSGGTSVTTDTWEEFEDMQGVMPNGMVAASPAAKGTSTSTVNLPGFAQNAPGQYSAPGRMPSMEGSVDDADQVSIDSSIDGHAEDIDMYGDGSAVGSPVPRAAPAVTGVAGPASGGMAGSAATFAGSAGIAIGKMARSALAALSGIPPYTQWVVLDDASANTRVVMLTAGSEVRATLSASLGGGPLVPFECSKESRIAPVVLLEARHIFMELLPSISDASERDMAVTLTGSGAGGSLATIVALMCANQGLGDNLAVAAFDAPACVAEESAEGGAGDNAALVDAVLRGGLLSQMGLPEGTIKTIFTTLGASASATVSPGRSGRVNLMRPLGTLLSMPVAPPKKA
ncbi:hypothetical protein FOA52_012307 [Chlamydomonas sp. UWO 241]|nr:hypothetical protein FOA52_012307 [Chlamydomonas sp. UWO 241]